MPDCSEHVHEHFHVELPHVVNDRNVGAVNKTDVSALPETGQPQEYCKGYETAWHHLNKTVVCGTDDEVNIPGWEHQDWMSQASIRRDSEEKLTPMRKRWRESEANFRP